MRTKLSVVSNEERYERPADPLDEKVVSNVTSALNAAFHIRPGRELVYVLGSGKERTNAEALETWVRASLLRTGVGPTQQGLMVLVSELEKHLNRHLLP